MRTNLFKFKKLKKDKITIEEERTDSPFLIFFKKNRKYILLLLLLLALIAIITAVYLAMRNMDSSTKIVTNNNDVVVNFEGDYNINIMNKRPISGGEALREFYKRYGNIGLTDGVILEVKEVKSPNGRITFYSDGSAKLIRPDGSIIRISSVENYEYGINENGEILLGAKTKEISITDEKTLEDGTRIIYYSDNSCEIKSSNNKNNMLARNSDKLVIENNRLKEILPSGISKELKKDNIKGNKITYYEDGTIKIEKGNNTYIVRNPEDINLNNMTFPNNNAATVLKKVNLSDASKIIYYTDGSAEIDRNGETIMVRQSKDIIYTKDKIIEITETKYANETITKNTKDGKSITYLDNAGGLIKNQDGTYEYVEENSDIKYDENGNLRSNIETIKEIDHRITPNGTLVIDLENGNSIIVDENGYRIVETNKIIYDDQKNIVRIIGDDDITDNDGEEDSITTSHFTIENAGNDRVKLMVVLEESDNYQKYGKSKLDPQYLRFNLVAGTTYLEFKKMDKTLPIGTKLEGNVTITKKTHILYEGILNGGKTLDVDLGIWIDYTDITNEYQESVFVGTLRVYSETIE